MVSLVGPPRSIKGAWSRGCSADGGAGTDVLAGATYNRRLEHSGAAQHNHCGRVETATSNAGARAYLAEQRPSMAFECSDLASGRDVDRLALTQRKRPGPGANQRATNVRPNTTLE